MGWNTGVIILNDAFHEIKKYPDAFIQNLDEAMGKSLHCRESVDVSVGGHVNAASVFHQAHADNVGVYAIGGNHTSKLLETYNGGRHYQSEDRIALLKQIADEMGYRIVKKKK
jgi:hypothetical protein